MMKAPRKCQICNYHSKNYTWNSYLEGDTGESDRETDRKYKRVEYCGFILKLAHAETTNLQHSFAVDSRNVQFFFYLLLQLPFRMP